jgi:hypothetical protein
MGLAVKLDPYNNLLLKCGMYRLNDKLVYKKKHLAWRANRSKESRIWISCHPCIDKYQQPDRFESVEIPRNKRPRSRLEKAKTRQRPH